MMWFGKRVWMIVKDCLRVGVLVIIMLMVLWSGWIIFRFLLLGLVVVWLRFVKEYFKFWIFVFNLLMCLFCFCIWVCNLLMDRFLVVIWFIVFLSSLMYLVLLLVCFVFLMVFVSWLCNIVWLIMFSEIWCYEVGMLVWCVIVERIFELRLIFVFVKLVSWFGWYKELL